MIAPAATKLPAAIMPIVPPEIELSESEAVLSLLLPSALGALVDVAIEDVDMNVDVDTAVEEAATEVKQLVVSD